jgi:predicted acylesterase/phospholipase RssA
VQIDGISGSCAGAINAVLLADGWCKGERTGARQGLADFWTALGTQLPLGMVVQGEGDDVGLSAVSKALVNWAGYFSPDQLNPFALSPLLAHAPFMQRLMLQGQERAQQWLATDFDCVEKRISVDLQKWFA